MRTIKLLDFLTGLWIGGIILLAYTKEASLLPAVGVFTALLCFFWAFSSD